MARIEDRFEYTTGQDVFYNYCLWEYKPLVDCEHKFRSINLLYHTFDLAGVDERAIELVTAIRQGIGPSLTVWGLKRQDENLRWEFYFYDYARRERERSITRLLDVIRPFVPCDIRENANDYYFMFSIDIDDALVTGARSLDEIHMYIGNVGSAVSSGICYSLTASGRRLENFYFFFDPKRHLAEIMSKVCCSAYVDTTVIDPDLILWPELKNCTTICVANKQDNDCIYFSGINVDQLLFFLQRMAYPDQIVSFVEDNRSNLDHLQYDVGIDYRMEGEDLVVLKSGYYGNF